MLVWLGRRTVQNMVIGSVHTVIWQAGTNWTGPVQIQIYYGPAWGNLLIQTIVSL